MCCVIKTIGSIVKAYIKIILIVMLLASIINNGFAMGIAGEKKISNFKEVARESDLNKFRFSDKLKNNLVSNDDIKKLISIISRVINTEKSILSRLSALEELFKNLDQKDNKQIEPEKANPINLNSSDIEKLQFLLDGIVSE